ncbi:hypothetical protein Vadar_005443 [Vaccinium darrowii]|uniref:Uncharacterized protein n=1 Tax=Vaccinium darrowii TaxID=229202 RepID=A0ACB7Z2P9_9ERIC|nr:hypothetical protein Vadar_005443 [Vaccinium darrowii]
MGSILSGTRAAPIVWPVILVPYNLPPWLAMKESFFMLTLLIPGDKQPGIDINVYMRPLVDELNELWQTGALTYDAFNQNHLERKKRVAYNGKHEKWKRSLEIPVEKIQEQLDNVTRVILGKNPSNRKRHCHEPNWTKISALYDLPYWKNKKLQHNIDVMHDEKNFRGNIVGTMVGIEGKNKDIDKKARKDLEDWGIRQELWLIEHLNGSYVKPDSLMRAIH